MPVIADSSSLPHTIGGWAAILLIPAVGALAWLVRRGINGVDELKASTTELVRSTAVLASQFADVRTATGKNTDEINDLKTATAVLKSWNDHHDDWAQRQSERMMDHIRHA